MGARSASNESRRVRRTRRPLEGGPVRSELAPPLSELSGALGASSRAFSVFGSVPTEVFSISSGSFPNKRYRPSFFKFKGELPL